MVKPAYIKPYWGREIRVYQCNNVYKYIYLYIYINHFSQLGETIRLFLEEQISLSYSVPTRGKDQQKNKWSDLHKIKIYGDFNQQTIKKLCFGFSNMKLNGGFHIYIYIYKYIIWQMGSCKNPEPFQMFFFHTLSFFFLLSCFQALASHRHQRIHMSEEREKEKKIKGKESIAKGRGKGKGKRKEKKKERNRRKRKKERKKERRRKRRRNRKSKGRERKTERKGRGKGEDKEKKDRVSHGAFLIPKVFVFVIVLLSFVNPVYVPFFWKWLQTSKKECSDYPGTFLMQNLTRICWHAITTTNNEMKKPKIAAERWKNKKTLDFKSLETDH